MANWQPGPNFHLLSVEEQEGLLRQQIDENCFIFDPSASMDLGAEVLDFLDPVAEAQSMVAPEVITGLGRQETVGSDDGVASGDVESSGDDAVVLHEVISTRVREALQGGVKHAICRVVLTGSNDSITNGDVMAVAQSLKEKITELYLEHIVQGARPADEAQMVLWTSTMESPISTPYRPVNDVTAEHLMTAIAKSQNSGATISFNDQLVLEFILIRKDPSWRIDSLPEVNAGRGVLHLLYFGQESDKRSLKQIADVGDNACMAKCVVLGVVHTEYRLAKKAWGARLEQDYTLPAKSPEEVALFATYKQLGKKRKVNSFLDKQVQKLYADSGVTQGKLCNLEDLKKFEAVVDVCLKVVSLKHTLKFIYQGSLRGDRMIYLLYTEDPKSKVGHFGLITNIRGFFSRNFFCMVCDIGYDNIYDHRCPDIPNLCYTCFDRTCIPNPSFKQGCQWCHAKYRSSKCGGRHLLASCKEKWRCPRCHQKSRRAMIPDEVSRQNLRPKTNAEMEASHDCNNFFCKECKIERPDDHKCFIAKKKLEPKLYKFIFFDFETDQSSGEHLVNFIHMKYFVRDEEDEKKDEKSKKEALKAAQRGDEDVTWDDSHLCNHEHWKGKWLECSFAGSDSLTRFFRFLSSHQFKDYTAIAHNMSGYDGIFLLRELVTNGVMPDVIVKGQRVLMMKIPRLNIRIIDSFNFLPMGLAKLPEAFGLECGEKGYFPHFYNRPQNAAYEGPLPEAKYYGVDLMGVGEKVKFEEWHSQQTSAEVVFNFQAEMKKYCRQDVNILTDSCLAYRKLMCLETDCDPFAYLTCASVCAAVYNANHMPPGSIAQLHVLK